MNKFKYYIHTPFPMCPLTRVLEQIKYCKHIYEIYNDLLKVGYTDTELGNMDFEHLARLWLKKTPAGNAVLQSSEDGISVGIDMGLFEDTQ